MTKTATRKIVRIDEDKCNGCGLCVPSCAEGAIRIIDGKARLVADNLCDGLGNCLGRCPTDAITIEQRPAEAFDEEAVRERLWRRGRGETAKPPPSPCAAMGGPGPASPPHGPMPTGCAGSRMRKLKAAAASAGPSDSAAAPPTAESRLEHWPVQLALLPAGGDLWRDADVLIAADCVGFAMPDFHERLLAGRKLAVACPKLDDVAHHIEKLSAIFADSDIRSVTVAHMQVPCCSGIVHAVREALERAGRDDIAFTDVTVGVNGAVLSEQNDD